MKCKEIEQKIQDKGLAAPRLTPADFESVIVDEMYHIFDGTTTMVCCLELKNGYTVTGESACISVDNFDEEIGKNVARTNAVNKIWMLEGYLLKDKLSATDNANN